MEGNVTPKLSRRTIECPICMDEFTRPKTLPCLHTFCYGCLQRLFVDPVTQVPILSIECPLCKRRVPRPFGGVDAFPDNFLLNEIMEQDRNSVTERTAPQAPKNVQYREKALAGVTIIGGDFQKEELRLRRPRTVVHDLGRLYVTDTGHDRIMAYDTDGANGREVYRMEKPVDITVSDGHVFVLGERTVHKINLETGAGRMIGTLTIRSSWLRMLTKQYTFQNCTAIVCHNNQLAVADQQTVVILTHDMDYVRQFQVSLPVSAMAMGGDGLVYLASGCAREGRVEVYDWGGQCVRSLGQGCGILGLAVDGDGKVCVSRFGHGSIDVYSADGEREVRIGERGDRPGQLHYPCGLCMLPDGKLVVVDRGNDRLQIF